MVKLYIMVGIPGSGKSTYAKQLAEKENAIILSSDTIRKELYGDESNQENYRLVFNTLNERLIENLSKGKNVIHDTTNLKLSDRRNIFKLIQNIPCKKICVFIDVSLETAIRQNNDRERKVPSAKIKKYLETLTVPTKEEGYDKIIVITPQNLLDWHDRNKYNKEKVKEYLRNHPEEDLIKLCKDKKLDKIIGQILLEDDYSLNKCINKLNEGHLNLEKVPKKFLDCKYTLKYLIKKTSPEIITKEIILNNIDKLYRIDEDILNILENPRNNEKKILFER